jgi:hypothetical protein
MMARLPNVDSARVLHVSDNASIAKLAAAAERIPA